MKTTEAVKGRWSEVFAAYGLPAINRMKHVDCPLCGKSKKFRIDDKDGSGSFICICLAGDGWRLLQETQGKDFRTLASEIDLIIGNTPDYEKSEPVKNTKLDKALIQFRTGQKLAETMAETYLHGRGLFVMPTGGCVSVSGAYHSETRTNYQALFALASNEFGEAIYSHTTCFSGLHI